MQGTGGRDSKVQNWYKVLCVEQKNMYQRCTAIFGKRKIQFALFFERERRCKVHENDSDDSCE